MISQVVILCNLAVLVLADSAIQHEDLSTGLAKRSTYFEKSLLNSETNTDTAEDSLTDGVMQSMPRNDMFSAHQRDNKAEARNFLTSGVNTLLSKFNINDNSESSESSIAEHEEKNAGENTEPGEATAQTYISRIPINIAEGLTNIDSEDIQNNTKVFALIVLFGMTAASLPLIHQPMYHHAPQPYKFGYDIKDKHGEQYRQEEGNGGHAVKGSYGFTDARGVKRQVDYIADHAGFRAQVKTNEPGTANQNPAAVLMVSDAPYAGGMVLGGMGLGGAALGGYGVGNVALGYGVVAPGYAVTAGLGGPGYGKGVLGYARYGY